jgi:hypothetical protein
VGTLITDENHVHYEIGRKVKEVLVQSFKMVSSYLFCISLKTYIILPVLYGSEKWSLPIII